MNILNNKKSTQNSFTKENIFEAENIIKHILVHNSIYIIADSFNQIHFIYNINSPERKVIKVKHNTIISGMFIANDKLIVYSNKTNKFSEYNFMHEKIEQNVINKKMKEEGFKKVLLCECKNEMFFVGENLVYCMNVDDYSFKYKVSANVLSLASSCEFVYFLTWNKEILIYKNKSLVERICLEDRFDLLEIYYFDSKVYALYEDYLKIYTPSFELHKLIKRKIKKIAFLFDKILFVDEEKLEEIVNDKVQFVSKATNINALNYDEGIIGSIGRKVFLYTK